MSAPSALYATVHFYFLLGPPLMLTPFRLYDRKASYNAHNVTLDLRRLSSLRPTKRECRRCPSGGHSANSNWPTSIGFSHRQSCIFSFVSPCPHRPLWVSGNSRKGNPGFQDPSCALGCENFLLPDHPCHVTIGCGAQPIHDS